MGKLKPEFDAAARMNDKCQAQMFINPSSLIGKSALAFGCAVLIHCANGFAGEAIQFSGDKPAAEKKPEQTSSEATPEQPSTSFSSKIFRAYRPGETVSSSGFFKPSSDFPRPQPIAPPSSRRDQEMLDRQRNWMFLTPDDEKKSQSADDVFGLEESSLTPRKGVIDRFLENKPAKPELNVNSLAPTLNKNQLDPISPNRSFLYGFENNSINDGVKQDRRFQNSSSLQPQFLDKNFVGGDSERSRMNDLWRNQFAPDTTRFREQRQDQMKEFEGLFSQGTVTPAGNGLGTLDSRSALNGYPQTAVPSTRSSDMFSSSAVADSSDPYKRMPTAIVGSSTLPPLDINTKVFGASAATPPPESLEPVKPIAQPAILPFPKRHF